MVFVSAGVRHAVGPFLKPMVADLHVDRATFSLVIALGLFLYGAFMPWVGGLADRLGPRFVTSAGACCSPSRSRSTGLCQNLWQLALVYGVLASLGLAATGPWWPTPWSRAGSAVGAVPRCPYSGARR